MKHLQRLVQIVLHIVILYLFYMIGTFIQTTFNLLIPGSVIGLILLFILLITNIFKVSWIKDGAQFMVNHLVLFFIPPTVGVMNYFNVFAGKGFLLVIITVISTILVIGTSGFISELIYKRKMSNE